MWAPSPTPGAGKANCSHPCPLPHHSQTLGPLGKFRYLAAVEVKRGSSAPRALFNLYGGTSVAPQACIGQYLSTGHWNWLDWFVCFVCFYFSEVCFWKIITWLQLALEQHRHHECWLPMYLKIQIDLWLPQNLTSTSLLLARSLPDNINCRLTRILYVNMDYRLYSYNKVS